MSILMSTIFGFVIFVLCPPLLIIPHWTPRPVWRVFIPYKTLEIAYLKEDQYASVPRRDRDWHFTAMGTRYAVPATGPIAGWVRAPPAIVRVARTRRQCSRTDCTDDVGRGSAAIVTICRVTVVYRRGLIRYDHRSARPMVFGLCHETNTKSQ